MSELGDWKRHVYEPEKQSFQATIRGLREEVSRLTTALSTAEETGRRKGLEEAVDASGKIAENILTALRANGLVVVPRVPSDEMWSSDLVRAIMMWLRQERPRPGQLLADLGHRGIDVPEWLKDEPEMKNPNHVPSKGTCAVILYRAMIPPPTQGKG